MGSYDERLYTSAPSTAPAPGGIRTDQSFALFMLFNIPVRVSYFFPIVIVLAVLDGLSEGWMSILWYVTLFGPLLFGTVLVHEFGHSLACLKLANGHVDQILLWPLGGLAYCGHGGSPIDDFKVAICGPLTHIPQTAIWLAILAISRPDDVSLNVYAPVGDHFWTNLVAAAIMVNIALFCFNLLLPAYPLDGGRILADLLLSCGVSSKVAAIVTLCIATPIAVLIVMYGIYNVAIMTIAVGVWVLFQNFSLAVLVRNGQVDQHPLFRGVQSGTVNQVDLPPI
ncbi:peptidase m50 domain protein [Klebsormidium nitens]|uniref:Peptidase m50 domain protein n=1 Tax=Klebsormidium nitens TaxID=105231 RepID=A0A1Y1HXX1_KLENI|nr:peptidase m50 domain protein [Klebsormidium nitens]|eukprot:GAQ83013.1 peptidase m50 domain protein [Klebsormidium nitens]